MSRASRQEGWEWNTMMDAPPKSVDKRDRFDLYVAVVGLLIFCSWVGFALWEWLR